MDFNEVLNAISNVGFPIAAFFAVGWYLKYQTDTLTKVVNDLKESIDDFTETIKEKI